MQIYIAEDEPLAAQKLQLFLTKLGERAEDITIFGNGDLLWKALESFPLPQLLFLDIQMPGKTGIEILQNLQTQGKEDDVMKVIITSAYDQYAIDGFNFGVTDYLLKPYTLDRLRQALTKVHAESLPKAQPEPVINLRCEGRTERIRVSDIVCLEALKDYTRFTLADNRTLTTLGTLSGFEQQLPESAFVRVQRSYVVSLSHIKNYNSSSVVLSTGLEVPIGKTYRETFEDKLKS